MACGVPVVATRVGAFEELIVPNETGSLVDIEDIDQMTSDIRSCLADPTTLERLSTSSRAHVLASFRLEDEAVAINAIYKDLLA